MATQSVTCHRLVAGLRRHSFRVTLSQALGLLAGDDGHDRLSEVLLVRVTRFQSMPA